MYGAGGAALMGELMSPEAAEAATSSSPTKSFEKISRLLQVEKRWKVRKHSMM